jgi:sugar phosphate isomerase/epimerase
MGYGACPAVLRPFPDGAPGVIQRAMLSRRALLAATAAAPLLPAAPAARIRWGVMDGVVGKSTDPAAVEIAKRLGFAGLQVTLGRRAATGKLVYADPARQSLLLSESKKYALPVMSTYLDILHADCLKNDPAAIPSAVEGIAITRALRAPILMLVFFGKCALETSQEMDAVVGPLKEISREAEKAGVILGFENTIKAEDDLRILDQVKSKALQVWYDIGNATNLYNQDPSQEIRHLGRDRICCLHFKDKGFLGEGKVDAKSALSALDAIAYNGYIVLETTAPTKNIESDLAKNLAYLNSLTR